MTLALILIVAAQASAQPTVGSGPAPRLIKSVSAEGGAQIQLPRLVSPDTPPKLETYCRASKFSSSSYAYTLSIDSAGRVTAVKFSEPPFVAPSSPAFLNAYRRFLLQQRYSPALSKGTPVATNVTTRVLISFR